MAWKKWNHIDFQWAIHANTYLNPLILDLLDNVSQVDRDDIELSESDFSELEISEEF